jgi:hypothetical protein
MPGAYCNSEARRVGGLRYIHMRMYICIMERAMLQKLRKRWWQAAGLNREGIDEAMHANRLRAWMHASAHAYNIY